MITYRMNQAWDSGKSLIFYVIMPNPSWFLQHDLDMIIEKSLTWWEHFAHNYFLEVSNPKGEKNGSCNNCRIV